MNATDMNPELTPAQQARLDARNGVAGSTRGAALGYVQCNLVIVRRELAYDFLLYCQRNQKACPVLEVCDAGDPEPRRIAPGADLRTDLPRYALYRNGERPRFGLQGKLRLAHIGRRWRLPGRIAAPPAVSTSA